MMRNYMLSIRPHLVIMVILYGTTWIIANNFVMRQQQEALKEYRNIKSKLEYDYLRIKSYPDYVRIIQTTISHAKNKIEKFNWLNSGYDSNLLFYQHISIIAEQIDIQILNLQPVDRDNLKYYFWNVSLKGGFPDIIKFIKKIESSEKFLKLESIEITNAEDEIEITLRIAGIKKLE